MSPPEDIQIMSKIAKDFIGFTVIGTLFNLCLVNIPCPWKARRHMMVSLSLEEGSKIGGHTG